MPPVSTHRPLVAAPPVVAAYRDEVHSAPQQPGPAGASDGSTADAPPEFVAVVESLRQAMEHTRPEISLTETRAPTRLAPHALALTAAVVRDDVDIAQGRLVLLHDPAGQEAWDGTFRFACFVRADLDAEMATDPVLPEVAWSWLEDALHEQVAVADALAGTVTVTRSSRFGALAESAAAEEDDECEVELRCSWSPRWDDDPARHLRSFALLLADMAGLPPDVPGVVSIAGRGRR